MDGCGSYEAYRLHQQWLKACSVPLQAGMQFAEIWALSPLSCLFFIPCGRVLQIPSVVPVRLDLSGPPVKHPAVLWELDVSLGFSFSHRRSCRSGGSGALGAVLCRPKAGAVHRKYGRSSCPLMWPFAASLWGRGLLRPQPQLLGFPQLCLLCG